MRRFLKYIAPYWKWTALAPLCMAVEVAMELLQPYFMSRVVDEGVMRGDLALIGRLCGVMLLTSLLAACGGMGCTFFAALAGQNFGSDVREALFERVVGLPVREADRLGASSLVTRLTQDVNNVQEYFQMILRMVVRQPLMVIGGCVMALSIHPRMCLVLVVLMPLVLGLAMLGFKVARPMFSKIQKCQDVLNGVLRECTSGVRVVKAFHRAEHEEKRFRAANEDLADRHVRIAFFFSLIMPFAFFCMNMGIVSVLWTGGRVVRQGGELTVGEIMAMVNYLMQILFSFMAVAFLLNDYARCRASSDRIWEVFDASGDAGKAGGAACPTGQGARLEFEHVRFQYPGASGEPVLQDVSFLLEPGQTLAVMGATGSGKSTLVQLIPRFHDCQAGRILLDGRDIREYSLKSLRDAVALVPQEAVLFNGTLRENVLWGREDATDQELQVAADTAQATEFIARFQDGWETIVGQRGLTLSGGQKQRVSIARALLRKPRLLILDDCSSALDAMTEARLRRALAAHQADTSVLMVAQRISSVQDADAIMVLSDGRVAGIGTHDELLRSCQVYQEIVASQTGVDAVASASSPSEGGQE